MTKQQQSNHANFAAKRFSSRLLLRSAIVAGIVAGLVGSTPAQSDLVIPSFPGDSAELSLPSAQVPSYPFAFSEPRPANPSTAKRVVVLLGLKKQCPPPIVADSVPAFGIPSFPSTEPTLLVAQSVPEQTATNTHAPTIFRSTSGKAASFHLVHDDATVQATTVKASAEESLSEVDVPAILMVQTALAIDEVEEESLEVSLEELSSETLTDIEIPKPPVQEVKQRLPELLRRSPAMQLHIGGSGVSRSSISDSEPNEPSSNNFSMSDADDSESEEIKVHKPAPSIMNVKIEGEPAQVVARPTVSPVTPVATLTLPVSVTSPASVTSAAAVPPLTSATVSTTAAVRKSPSFDVPSSNAGHKSLTDNSTANPPTIGERLEVGLHESANVETVQPISGLSVEHPELCQVLKSGERSISFVGLKAGQTRVALFTTNAAGERKIEIREVVIAGAETRQADMKSLAAEIGKSVRRMYPNSRIEVIAEAEGLTVQGYAGSEAEAKKIIGLVRRTSLQPVVDRLATYK